MLHITQNDNNEIICNLSVPMNYYSQKNNEVDPYNTCSTTSMIQALEVAGYDKYFPKIFPNYRQPEDKLTHFIRNDKRVLEYWKKTDPDNYRAWATKTGCYYEPNEVHPVLSYATNLFMGRQVTKFMTAYSLDEIIYELMGKQKPCVMSGKFNGLNHVVTVVGCVFDKKAFGRARNKEKAVAKMKFSDVKYMMIDDTYGLTGEYTSGKKGDDVLVTPQRFRDEFKPLDNPDYKWCHIIL